MAIVPLSGSLRESVGKGPARQSRREGRIPGVIYGHGEAATAIAVDTKEFTTAMRHHAGGNMIVTLNLSSGDRTALIREVQRDPLSSEILHLDFQEVSLKEKVRVNVNIEILGVPKGVKEGGGILEHILRQVELECLATAIPSKLEVDVSELNIGENLHVRDLASSSEYEILTDADSTVAIVVPPTVQETPTEGEGEEEAAPAEGEPEVIAKGKEEKAEEGKAEEKS